jgi:hypothetical protein
MGRRGSGEMKLCCCPGLEARVNMIGTVIATVDEQCGDEPSQDMGTVFISETPVVIDRALTYLPVNTAHIVSISVMPSESSMNPHLEEVQWVTTFSASSTLFVVGEFPS